VADPGDASTRQLTINSGGEDEPMPSNDGDGTAGRGYNYWHVRMRTAHMRLLAPGARCPCGGRAGGCGPSCPCDPIPQPMFSKAADNWDGKPLSLDHRIPLAVSGRRGERHAFHEYRLVLAICNSSRGDGTRGHSNTKPARHVDRDGYRIEQPQRAPRPAPTPAPPPLSPVADYDDLPRWPDSPAFPPW
jgi:hypothetical protein